MIETLLGLDHGYHVVFGPGDVMVYAHRQPVAEIGALFDATALVVQRIPALVRSRTPEVAVTADAWSRVIDRRRCAAADVESRLIS